MYVFLQPNYKYINDMKKIALLLMLACTSVCMANTDLDTVFGRYPYYYYHWFDSCIDHDTVHDGIMCRSTQTYPIHRVPLFITNCDIDGYHIGANTYPKELAVGYVPTSNMRIIGMVYTRLNMDTDYYPAWANTYPPSHFWLLDSLIWHNAESHFNIYDNEMHLLTSKTIMEHAIDTHAARKILSGRTINGSKPIYDTAFEVFFDTPIDVSDTFFLSKTVTWIDTAFCADIIMCREMHYHTWGENELTVVTVSRFPKEIRRYRDDPFEGEWKRDTSLCLEFFANMYPIIERPGDTCGQIRGLHYQLLTPTFGLLKWTAQPNQSLWEVSYGPAGTLPGEGRVTETNIAQLAMYNLSPDTQYVAYVRAKCVMARTVWTDWSDSVTVTVSGSGIDETVGAQFSLSPNPASGQVTVTAEEGLRHIEVYDIRGALVYSAAADGTTAVVETKAWPTGQYVVTVETRAGKGSRVLTVAR